MPSPFEFRPYGESGIEVSEIFARTAAHVDDLCFIRSMFANTPNHEQSMRLMNCGDERLPRPSYGSWLTYGLGTENRNLPGFVALCPGLPVSDVSNWRSAFLPGIYQGTHINTRESQPSRWMDHLTNARVSPQSQRRQLDWLREFNGEHRRVRGDDPQLEARIQSFELAYRMQLEATDAFDYEREPASIRAMYGDTVQARQLLIARRLIERGVRVVQCYHGDVQPWDSHDMIADAHRRLASEVDQGIAALLTDLKQRGLFEDTLVLCGGEFGRTPAVEMPAPGTPGNGKGGSQPLGLHRVAGGWRGEAGACPWRHRRVWVPSGGAAGACARPACNAAAPHGTGPRASDVPSCGPGFPPHRRPRRGGAGHPRLKRDPG